jgi:hypothetical protein
MSVEITEIHFFVVIDLLNYFSSTEPPSPPENDDFGVELPNHLSFPLAADNLTTQNIIFVRKCYSTLLRIVVEAELATDWRCGVAIFTGPQGNGKVSFLF